MAGNRVGVRRDGDGNLRFLLNGEDMGVAATNLPEVSNCDMTLLLNLLSLMWLIYFPTMSGTQNLSYAASVCSRRSVREHAECGCDQCKI